MNHITYYDPRTYVLIQISGDDLAPPKLVGRSGLYGQIYDFVSRVAAAALPLTSAWSFLSVSPPTIHSPRSREETHRSSWKIAVFGSPEAERLLILGLIRRESDEKVESPGISSAMIRVTALLRETDSLDIDMSLM